MNEKLYLVDSVSPADITREASDRDRVRNVFVASVVLILLLILAVNRLQPAGSAAVDAGSSVVVPAPVSSNDEFAYYTERYWKMAEAEVPAASVEPEARYAYYTERYWKMADAGARESTAATETPTVTEPDYAYYTERYWKMDDHSAAVEEEDYAFYTERYWRQAEER